MPSSKLKKYRKKTKRLEKDVKLIRKKGIKFLKSLNKDIKKIKRSRKRKRRKHTRKRGGGKDDETNSPSSGETKSSSQLSTQQSQLLKQLKEELNELQRQKILRENVLVKFNNGEMSKEKKDRIVQKFATMGYHYDEIPKELLDMLQRLNMKIKKIDEEITELDEYNPITDSIRKFVEGDKGDEEININMTKKLLKMRITPFPKKNNDPKIMLKSFLKIMLEIDYQQYNDIIKRTRELNSEYEKNLKTENPTSWQNVDTKDINRFYADAERHSPIEINEKNQTLFSEINKKIADMVKEIKEIVRSDKFQNAEYIISLPTFIQDITAAVTIYKSEGRDSMDEINSFIMKDFISTIENLKNEFVRITVFDKSFEEATVVAAQKAVARREGMVQAETKREPVSVVTPSPAPPSTTGFFGKMKNFFGKGGRKRSRKRGGRRKKRRKIKRRKIKYTKKRN